MKTVCIVGSGPAGLVAAKTLLQSPHFQVTVYEKNDRLGGIWAIDEDTQDGWLSPQTPTNLSRFTVGFADLDWNAVDLRSKHTWHSDLVTAERRSPPMFPKAWQVNRYLETYRRKFILDGLINFSSKCVKAEHIQGGGSKWHWRVTIEKGRSKAEVRDFDYLLLASGFFAQPREIKQNVPGVAKATSEASMRAIHSSQFRDLNDLFPNDDGAAGKSVLLLGGGNSSGETAAAVAMQLSNAQWSPDTTRQKPYQGCKVLHVTPRPLYALPPFNEYEKGSCTYVALDFKLYDFSRRPPGLESYGGQQAKEVRDIIHNSIQKMVGSDQSDLGSEALANSEGTERGSPYVALTESYPEFVRSGLIEVIGGRVIGVDPETTSATIRTGDGHTELDNIGAIIYATGYTPVPAFDFLDEKVKAALQYDPQSMRLPLILGQWQTCNTAFPNLSFLGFYEGPYWPMIEMQARLTAQRWLNDVSAKHRPFEEEDQLINLRQAMHDRALGVPQFWFSDYVGYMEDVAAHLGLPRNDGMFGEREGCISPARYLSEHSDTSETNAVMKDLYECWHACVDQGKYVPRAAFRALQGNWTINRHIESSDTAFSGTLEGEATFHPRYPTQDQTGQTFDLEYLYVESGVFRSSSGMAMKARRRYVYRYSEARDELSVWFVKPSSDLEVDYLFHNLRFVEPAEARQAGACTAKADHLCVNDMYWTEYRLPIEGIALHEFRVTHTVKGPGKDYVATTRYSRPRKSSSEGEV